jgi:6-phosphofructokinase 1
VAQRNALYAQSGGVTAVINATACAVIETARKYRSRIGKVLAGRDGIIGVLTEDLIDTSKETPAAIRALRHTPGGAFGSCRYKLKGLEEDRAQYERLLAVFKAHDIGYFFYNGGNDSADTAWKVSQLAERMSYPLVCIGIPKTVDNDLIVTDSCPGFGSVAKYVATSMRETGFDVASMARTSTKVFVLEVMGRHAGWITAACALAAEREGDAPHILLFPELPFDPERFLARVEEVVKRYGFCAVAVSEGLRDKDGKFLSESGVRDAFGHAQLGGVAPRIAGLVRNRFGYRCHWAVADYLQRSARHLASRTDLEQAYAVGEAAVKLALEGRNAVMPVIVRKSNRPYRWAIGVAPLEDIANREKKVPRDFITEDGFYITKKCRQYLAPLIQGEAPPPFKNGLPAYVRLRNVPVRRRLAEEFKV